MCGRVKPGEAWGGRVPDDPAEVERQMEALERRFDQVRRQEVTPRRLYYRLPEVCPLCWELLGGEEGPPPREALMLAIEGALEELGRRVRRPRLPA
jgi:hypothetical protein